MSKFEVIQSRVSERFIPSVPQPTSKSASVEEKSALVMETRLIPTQRKSQITLDDTELSVIKLLGDKPMSSVEIKELIGKSREHAARMMKALFDSGLVTRDNSKKPFVYQLTETGRRYLSAA
jgi:CRP-like cAMP-binding protein